MELKVKSYSELTKDELYEILRARAEIFVVEQECAYQDLDGKDKDSLHLFYSDGEIKAYMRAFYTDDDAVQIGRVLTIKHGEGLGGRLLKEGIAAVEKKMNPDRIIVEAQTYAAGFYERESFKICSGEFLEDGIPHVKMIRKK